MSVVSFEVFKKTCHEFVESHLAQKRMRQTLKQMRDDNKERDEIISLFLKNNKDDDHTDDHARRLTLQMPSLRLQATFVLKEKKKKRPVTRALVTDTISDRVEDSGTVDDIITQLYEVGSTSPPVSSLSLKTRTV